MILSPCKGFKLAYLDDIVTYSRTWREHVRHLRQVFKLLQMAGSKVNPRKSKLGFREIKYLAYRVGQGHLTPHKKKVDVILQAIQPQTKKHLRQFLGLVGYYSHFITESTIRASPSTDLLGKRQPDKLFWDPRAQEAFENLRRTLVFPPVLVSPDFTWPFVVQTDASSTSLGAMLMPC